MGIAWRVAIGVAAVSLILGILVRFGIAPGVRMVSPSAFLRFTDTCLLAAIAFLLAELLPSRPAEAAEPEEEAQQSE